MLLIQLSLLSFQMVEEWYFSKPNWRVRSGSLNDERQVPLGLTVYGQGGRSRQVMNFFNFDAEAADPTLFDIKPCFTWEEQRLVRFSLSGNSAFIDFVIVIVAVKDKH